MEKLRVAHIQEEISSAMKRVNVVSEKKLYGMLPFTEKDITEYRSSLSYNNFDLEFTFGWCQNPQPIHSKYVGKHAKIIWVHNSYELPPNAGFFPEMNKKQAVHVMREKLIETIDTNPGLTLDNLHELYGSINGYTPSLAHLDSMCKFLERRGIIFKKRNPTTIWPVSSQETPVQTSSHNSHYR